MSGAENDESTNPICKLPSLQVGSGNIMAYGIFSWLCMGPLVHVKNIQGYLSVISEQVHPFILIKYPARDRYFQQANDLCCTAGIVPKWFKKHGRNFALFISAIYGIRSQIPHTIFIEFMTKGNHAQY
ncbi:hypothetical protein TNCV_647671 [Trichonephila clavipes]|uniref:Uncharacterized protein n=1 Tax=Trichonephila clavipes TaxID=2585209 RepID=A0A8X6VNB6_TRICX|nr:hypothetical protein TNCV_647671 [Trichonephila clavipes]